MKRAITLSLSLFLSFHILAQVSQGALKGKVVDQDTGDPIPFANIVLFEVNDTSTIKAGATSDFDGKYTIKPIKPGMYTIKASFVGYSNLTVNNVKIEGDKTTYYDIKLTSGLMLEALEVVHFCKLVESDNAYTGDRFTVEPLMAKIRGSRAKKSKQNFFHNQTPSISKNEGYDEIVENKFQYTEASPVSTFSIDVDVASYSNVRRMIRNGELPPEGAVRIEEMINYFDYDYPNPTEENPFSIHTELGPCHWNDEHLLLKVGLQSEKIEFSELPPNNITFLLDVSGSMQDYNKLPLLKRSLRLMVNQLRKEDRVAIVVYAGSSGLVLPSTKGSEKEKILKAIDDLYANGSTAGGQGIKLAYEVAEKNLIRKGNNRIILATDGDFNVGISNDDELVKLIEGNRDKGIFLTVLGFGMGNLKDSKLEKLADHGNGNYAYIDDFMEAKKVLVNELGANLITVAKDVKLQIEFNPAKVQAYRLIGYENRMLDREDFNDDKKDAGEMGAGHNVTALYEIVPLDVEMEKVPKQKSDDLKYQTVTLNEDPKISEEALTIKIRYKKPDERKSKLMVSEVVYEPKSLDETSQDFRFSTAIAQFGMLLRKSEHRGTSTFENTIQLAQQSIGIDESGYKTEFVELVKLCEKLY